MDEEKDLNTFIKKVSDSGCKIFIVHARKAWLKGLSPRENRNIPPLNYERVYKLKDEFPHLEIIINGGLENIEDSKNHLTKVDGVMMGRESLRKPFSVNKSRPFILWNAFFIQDQKRSPFKNDPIYHSTA